MNLNNVSKYISLILRHKPEVINITLDNYGYANVNDLITGIKNTKYPNFNLSILEEIVRTDNKQRYSFNEDKTRIRANQGHSIPVDVELHELTKEEINNIGILYHGTSSRFVDSINKKGILSMERNYVQLSPDINIAKEVGSRHNHKDTDKVCIYVIDIISMYNDNIKIYRSVNNVYLTKYIDPKYFIKKIVLE